MDTKLILEIVVLLACVTQSSLEAVVATIEAKSETENHIEQIAPSDSDHDQSKRMHPPIMIFPSGEGGHEFHEPRSEPKVTFIQPFPLTRREEDDEYYDDDDEPPTGTPPSFPLFPPFFPPPSIPFMDYPKPSLFPSFQKPSLAHNIPSNPNDPPEKFPFKTVHMQLFPIGDEMHQNMKSLLRSEFPKMIENAPFRSGYSDRIGPHPLASSPSHLEFAPINKGMTNFKDIKSLFSKPGIPTSTPTTFSTSISTTSISSTTEKTTKQDGYNNSDEEDDKDETVDEDDAEPKCFTIPGIYHGTRKMVRKFRKEGTWGEKLGSVGRSMKDAAYSIKNCAQSVWNGAAHFLGFQKRSISEGQDEIASVIDEPVEKVKRAESGSDIEEEKGVWSQTKRMARSAQTLVENTGEKAINWFYND